MNRKKLIYLIYIIGIVFCSPKIFSQWIYETNRDLKKDIIISYKVTYENELTEAQKKLPNYIKEVLVILNDQKLIEKVIRYPYNKSSVKLCDYDKNKYYRLYLSNKTGFSYEFKEPKFEARLQKNNAKNILGMYCEKYVTLLKGKPVEIYSTKELGLRFVHNYKIDGLLMEYTDYDNKLGYYNVKAEKINSFDLPATTFSLEDYQITPYSTYRKEYNERRASQKKLVAESMGKQSPKFYARTIDNKKISSKKMLGNSVVVLNFWFHTCPPCKKEIPKLNELRNQYKKNKNVKFIAIGLDNKSTIEQFLTTHPIDYDVVDEGRWLATKFGITSYPTNIIIDKQGKIQFFEVGYKTSIKGIMTNKIDELLDE
ncbi:TlpA family protein disulfide reductase [Wenyingzhuangia sp. IMCC45533]